MKLNKNILIKKLEIGNREMGFRNLRKNMIPNSLFPIPNSRLYFFVLFVILFAFLSISKVFCDKPVLRWAADAEGNAPYITQDPRNPTATIGFEVDIANAIAEVLGMKSVFVQNQWDGLIPGLNINNYDIALNGIEITQDRKAEINFSDPYYVTYEQLVVMNGTENINSLSDLIGKRAGACKGTLAERILGTKAGIKVSTYDGEVAAMTDMVNGRLDAVLCDGPIAIYYAKPDPKFKLVGQPIGEISYGIALRKSDTLLLDKINSAINKISTNGKLREILERWNLWNYMMAIYMNDRGPSNTPPTKFQYYMDARGGHKDFKAKVLNYISYLPLFAQGAFWTLAISICAMMIAIIIGLLVTLLRLYTPKPFSSLAVLYVELIRGTPLLIQIYFIYYALPNIGIKIPAFIAAVIGLGLNYAAYEAENYRAGFYSVPRGQMEAAVSLGMTRKKSLRYVILPQAIRFVIPPMTNDFISLLKDSSIVSLIALAELTKVYQMLATSTFDYFGTGIMVAVIYLLIGLPFVKLARYVEKVYSVDLQKKDEKRVAL